MIGVVARRAEQNRAWHDRRRARGLCATARCAGRLSINPRTGVEYWHCDRCRAVRRVALGGTR